MEIYHCIVADDSTGAPLALFAGCYDRDAPAGLLLDGLSRTIRYNNKSVTLASGLFSMDVAEIPMLAQASNVRRLREFKSDWRDVCEGCITYGDSTPLSLIKQALNYPDDSVYLIVFCNLREQASLHPIPEEQDGTRRHYIGVDRPSVAAAIQANIKPPSTSAKNENLIHTERENIPEAVYDGRPANLSGPSITIYHPIFSEFKEKLGRLPAVGEIPLSDLRFALLFVDTSALYFHDELERREALRHLVVYFLQGEFQATTFACGKTSITPDGHRRAECGLFPLDHEGRDSMLACIEGLKNGIGLSGQDPIEQAAKGYVLMSTMPELADLRAVSCMPAFLLGIAGPFITVAGAIYVNGVISQRFTDMICLVADSSSSVPLEGYVNEREKHIYKIAHLFRTLRYCLDKLCKEYLELSPTNVAPPTSNNRTVMPAPHFTTFLSMDSRKFTLSYQDRFFESRSTRAVFLAKAKSDDGALLSCVVKFTSRYCQEAHELVQAIGVAPKLLYCAFEPSVGKFCVVMEYIEESRSPLTANKDKVIDAMKTAMKTLHENSYVFGDLRSANIIIDTRGHPYLIDFDWSGKEGTVFYPTDINTKNVEWAEGVEGGGQIRRRHDEEMLQKYIDELQAST